MRPCRVLIPMIALCFAAVGCAAAPAEEEDAVAANDALSGCTSTGAEIQLRSFIPQSLCGKSDTDDDSEASCEQPGGFPEPPLGLAFFHGDHRGHSADWNATSRVWTEVRVASLAPRQCYDAAGSFLDNAGTSHRCAPHVLSPGYQLEAKAPDVGRSIDERRCEGALWHGTVQAHAGYPFNGASPHVFDKLEVTSHAEGSPAAKVQHYSVDFAHTPFPYAEMLVRYACGTKTVIVHSYDAHDCGPGPGNLGSLHAEDVRGTVRFAIKPVNGSMALVRE